ncbi:MAG: TIGR03086 family metal-binding protein [Chloroflexota bacterium]
MNIIEVHERALDELGRIVAGVKPEQMSLETPCTEWNVQALLAHIVASNLMFAAAAEGTPGERIVPSKELLGTDPTAAYRESAEILKRAWRQPGRLEQPITMPFGTMPGEAALGIRLTETVIHGWDLATATGQEARFDREAVGASMGFSQRALSGERPPGSPFGPALDAPDGCSEIDSLAAFLGRKVPTTA